MPVLCASLLLLLLLLVLVLVLLLVVALEAVILKQLYGSEAGPDPAFTTSSLCCTLRMLETTRAEV
jgi:hypothetical protein